METLWQIEANIDDMNPQNMEYVFQKLLDLGVNDVWAIPMMMKKCRMASMLCALYLLKRRPSVSGIFLFGAGFAAGKSRRSA